MTEVAVLQGLLIPARGGIDDDVGRVAIVAEPLIVAVAGMAGVEEQDAAAVGGLDGLLEIHPGHHGRITQRGPVPSGVSGQEPVALSLIAAMARNEQQNRIVGLALAQRAHRIEDMGSRRGVQRARAIDEDARDGALMQGPEAGGHGPGEGLGIRAGHGEIALHPRLTIERDAGFAKVRIFIDADGEDVERAALVEIAFALMRHRDLDGSFAGFVDGDHADGVAALGERHG